MTTRHQLKVREFQMKSLLLLTASGPLLVLTFRFDELGAPILQEHL
jgi:hypothetical protein